VLYVSESKSISIWNIWTNEADKDIITPRNRFKYDT
jgi:hypothetical protein